jgi:hypothetical protein
MIDDIDRSYLEVGQLVTVNIPRDYEDVYSNSIKEQLQGLEGTLVSIIPAEHGLCKDHPSYYKDSAISFSFLKRNKTSGWRGVVKFEESFTEDGSEYNEKEILLSCLDLVIRKIIKEPKKVYNYETINKEIKAAIIATISEDKELLQAAKLAKAHQFLKSNLKTKDKWDWEPIIVPIVEIATDRIIKAQTFTRAIVREIAPKISYLEIVKGISI